MNLASFVDLLMKNGGPVGIAVAVLLIYILFIVFFPAFYMNRSRKIEKTRQPIPEPKETDLKTEKSSETVVLPVSDIEEPNTPSNVHEEISKNSIIKTIDDLNDWLYKRNLIFRRIAFGTISLLLVGYVFYLFYSILLTRIPFPNPPSVSLTSIKYSYGGWDPRLIDLRNASKLGIAAQEKDLLRFYDFWVSSSSNLKNLGYKVKAKIYAGEELIGETEAKVIQPDAFQLGELKLINYADGNRPDSWVVQKGWDSLFVKIVCLKDTTEISETVSTIRLTKTNQSFLYSPPQAYFLSIAFSINDEAPRLLDLAEAPTKGIGVSAGTTFEIRSLKVRTSMVSPQEWMRAEAYISEGSWESEVKSKSVAFSEPVVSIPFDEPMRWQITDKDKSLVLTLYRADGTVMDAYNIPLRAMAETSLIDYSSAVVWPFDKITYLDFEKYSEVKEWQPEDDQPITIDSTTQQAFSGHRSLYVRLDGVLDDGKDYIIHRNIAFQSNLIIGQVYWPSTNGISINYAALCIGGIGHCFDLPPSALISDRWNTFYIDLSTAKDKDDQPFNSQEFKSFYFQADVRGVQTSNPYTFFLDGVQIFPVSN